MTGQIQDDMQQPLIAGHTNNLDTNNHDTNNTGTNNIGGLTLLSFSEEGQDNSQIPLAEPVAYTSLSNNDGTTVGLRVGQSNNLPVGQSNTLSDTGLARFAAPVNRDMIYNHDTIIVANPIGETINSPGLVLEASFVPCEPLCKHFCTVICLAVGAVGGCIIFIFLIDWIAGSTTYAPTSSPTLAPTLDPTQVSDLVAQTIWDVEQQNYTSGSHNDTLSIPLKNG